MWQRPKAVGALLTRPARDDFPSCPTPFPRWQRIYARIVTDALCVTLWPGPGALTLGARFPSSASAEPCLAGAFVHVPLIVCTFEHCGRGRPCCNV